jgi:DNA-binding HxlR family transcriptional regulator
VTPHNGFSHPLNLSDLTPKGLLVVLAFFSRHRQGLSKDIVMETGLSERTVRRRLEELEKSGILEAIQTKTFPSARRYRLDESSEQFAQAANALLQKTRK